MLRCSWFVVALLPCLAAVRTASAVDYEYRAPEGCPDQTEFVNGTVSRLTQAEERTSVERVVVSVVYDEVYSATLLLYEPGFEPVSRSLQAEDCSEVVQAVALTTALALDARNVPAAEAEPIDLSPRHVVAPELGSAPPQRSTLPPPPIMVVPIGPAPDSPDRRLDTGPEP